MWNYDDYDKQDREHQFDVRCGSCGEVRSNLEGYSCPQCGSSSESYSGADAKRWNDYNDRRRR